MRNKIIGGLLVAILVVAGGILPVNAYQASDWQTGSGTYGTVVEVDSDFGILNFKGKRNEVAGMSYGPFTKVNQQKFANGIKEEVNVELNLDEVTHGELFDLSLSLDDVNDDYVTEIRTTTQKVQDKFVVKASFDSNFSFDVTESGVYTYKYEIFKENDKTYGKFTLLLKGNEIATTGKVDLDVAFNSTTPFAEKIDAVRSLWFTSIDVAEGVNVYEVVPVDVTFVSEGVTETVQIPIGSALTKDEVEELIVELNAELEAEGFKFGGFYADEALTVEYDMTQPFNADVKIYMKLIQLREDENENITNPDTSDLGLVGIIATIVIAGAGLGYTIKKRRFN